MPRSFDGIDDYIELADGGPNVGYGTWFFIVKRATTALKALLTFRAASGADTTTIEIRGNAASNVVSLYNGSVTKRSTSGVVNADGWVFVAVTKTTGTTTPRFHIYKYATNAWIHENAMDGSLADAVSPVGYRLSGWYDGASITEVWNGDMALAGWIGGTALSDAQVEAMAYSLKAILSMAPSVLWLLDQDSTSQKVADLIGSGANESALSGTTVSSASVPVWSYGHEPIVVTRSSPPPAAGAVPLRTLLGVGG